MKQIKVLSYNIHKGFTIRNKEFVLSKIRDAIRLINPDIVFLQEVLGDHSNHKIDDWINNVQFEYLAHELWSHYAYGKNAVYEKGHHGNAILSKYPIISYDNINISTNPMEQRGVLHAVIDYNDQKVHALCLHLNLLESGRRIQVKKICERINNYIPETESIIMAGDFNDWKNKISVTFQEKLNMKEAYLSHHGKHAKTFPSYMPLLQLDRIYYRLVNIKEAVHLRGDPWNSLSDHIALFATFEL
jgi:endonuclease/exonuclease/phosphatase family metal-dependent hydrolase